MLPGDTNTDPPAFPVTSQGSSITSETWQTILHVSSGGLSLVCWAWWAQHRCCKGTTSTGALGARSCLPGLSWEVLQQPGGLPTHLTWGSRHKATETQGPLITIWERFPALS